MEEFVERRECTRTSFFTKAIISSDSIAFEADVSLVNISISGMFVLTDRRIPVGTACTIQIVISGQYSKLVLDDIKGEVIRQNDVGLAIHFTSNMEWFVLFKVYTRYGCEKKS